MKIAAPLISIVFVSVSVHCQELYDMTWEGRRIRYEPFLIYHHELHEGNSSTSSISGPGRLICSALHPIRGIWYFPDGEKVANDNISDKNDFWQRHEIVSNRSVSRLSRLRNLRGLRIDPRANGLWQCRFTLSNQSLSVSFYIGLYTIGLGIINNISCVFIRINQKALHVQLRCTSIGGPPTTYGWRYNGIEIARNRETLSGWINAVNLNISFDNQQSTNLSIYRCVLSLSGFYPGVYEYSVSNRAMTESLTEGVLVQGAPPTDVTALYVGSETVRVSWKPPRVPPGNGYRITVNNDSSTAVVLTELSYQLVLRPGVYSIQVRSLSQHYPGDMAEVDSVYVPTIYAESLSTSAGVSWPYYQIDGTVTVTLTRLTGPNQELCPNFEDRRIFTTTRVSLLFKNLEEFSIYTVTVSSAQLPTLALNFTTLGRVPSRAPHNFTHTITTTNVSVRWDAIDCIDLNSPFVGYEVDFARVDGTETSIGEIAEETFVATELKPGTIHTFRIAVLNTEGRGPFSNAITLHQEEIPKQAFSSTVSDRVFIGVGIATAISILILLCSGSIGLVWYIHQNMVLVSESSSSPFCSSSSSKSAASSVANDRHVHSSAQAKKSPSLQ